MKRILTIQDISCLGKCSITVALPVISAMGVETTILPTAVLSTHTMFQNFTVKDLTDQLVPITEHWKKEGIHLTPSTPATSQRRRDRDREKDLRRFWR